MRRFHVVMLLTLFVALTAGSGIPARGQTDLASHNGSKLSDPGVLPQQISVNELIAFRIHYSSTSNDVPINPEVDLTTPTGQSLKVSLSRTNTPGGGFTLDANYTPTENGVYKYRYTCSDATGPLGFPPDTYLSFHVQPDWLPWVITVLGVLLSMLAISALVYQVVHRLFGASQTASARVAIMIGIICSMVSILYAWGWLDNLIAWIAAGVVVLLLVVWALVVR